MAIQMRTANAINRALRPLGVAVIRRKKEASPTQARLDPSSSRMTSGHHQHLVDELASKVATTLAPVFGDRDSHAVGWVFTFLENFASRPFEHNQWGPQFHNLFWLYMITRWLAPDQIIESGVLRGQSTWALATAAPTASIKCFDLDFPAAMYRHDRAEYYEQDWLTVDLATPSDRHLAFFDCHVSHAQRIREAYDRGFRTLVFDDDLPGHLFYQDFQPPAPTVNMLMSDPLPAEGERFSWLCRDSLAEYTFVASDLHGAKDLVQTYLPLPSVGELTKYGTRRGYRWCN